MGPQNIFKYLQIQRFFSALLRSGWALWIWMPRSVIACETFYFCRDIQILFGPSIHIWYLMKCEKLRNKVMNLKWSKGRYFFWLCPSRVDISKSKSQEASSYQDQCKVASIFNTIQDARTSSATQASIQILNVHIQVYSFSSKKGVILNYILGNISAWLFRSLL